MELITYISIYSIGLSLLFFPDLIRDRFFFIFWFLSALTLSLVIRSSIGLTHSADIDGYILYMQANDIKSLYLREPIFWFGTRYLYNLIGDGIKVFVILDIILFLFLYKGFTYTKNIFSSEISISSVKYVFFLSLIFFPFVLGMHNYYRQILASVIFISAIGYCGNNKIIKGLLMSLIAVLIHNASAIFFPLLMIVIDKRRYKIFAFVSLPILLISIDFILGLSSGGLTERIGFEAGRNIHYLYLLSLIILISFISYFETKNLSNNYRSFVYFLLITIIIYIYSLVTMTSGQSERLLLYIFAIIFPFLAYYFEERFKPKILIRFIFYHVALSPLFFLYSSTIDLTL